MIALLGVLTWWITYATKFALSPWSATAVQARIHTAGQASSGTQQGKVSKAEKAKRITPPERIHYLPQKQQADPPKYEFQAALSMPWFGKSRTDVIYGRMQLGNLRATFRQDTITTSYKGFLVTTSSKTGWLPLQQ